MTEFKLGDTFEETTLKEISIGDVLSSMIENGADVSELSICLPNNVELTLEIHITRCQKVIDDE